MTMIVLDRQDIDNPIHPHLFDGICEDLGLIPEAGTDRIDRITLFVAKAEVD